MSSEQENLFKEKKKHQHSKRCRNAIIVKNSDILANNARNLAAIKRKQSQQYFTTVLTKLLVRMIHVEYI